MKPRDDEHHFSKRAEDVIAAFRRLPSDFNPAAARRPKPLGDLVEALLVKHQIGRPAPEQALRDRWPQIVGPACARDSHIARIEPGGKLLVFVGHAVVRQELFHYRQTILARIREVPGCEHIKALNLRAG